MRWSRILIPLLLVVAGAVRGAPLVEQSFELRSGWNSIWLEVQPTNDAPAAVFAGLPIESAWTFRHRLPTVDFIQDVTEPVWNRDQWLSWVPADRPEAIANSLFAIASYRAYLIKLTNSATLAIHGTCALRSTPWRPDAYNLRGFPVDPGSPPTFGDFFRPSAAHFFEPLNQLRPIYQLNSSGTWERVAATDLMRAGVAYWTFCEGSSTYEGPLEVRFALGGEGLPFGRQVAEFEFSLVNHRRTTVHASLGESPASSSTILAYASISSTNSPTWNDLPSLLLQELSPGQTRELRLASRRQRMSGETYESVVEIRDNVGTRYRLPVEVRRITSPAEARSHAGLWIGVAAVQRVSESHSGSLVTNLTASDGTPLEVTRAGVNNTPTPTRSSFNLRLLIHVDAAGTARLLREVTVMWQDGTYRVDASGESVVDTPGRYVLVTDPTKVSRYQGVSLRNDKLAGRRFSSVGFDFPGSGSGNTDNFLPLDGTFATGSSVTGTIHLSENFATNPFKHRYHPDHDNLDARFTDFRAEAYAITRAITFELLPNDPGGEGPPPADYGYSHLAGIYRETISGLHREPILAEGLFRLKRITEASDLNP